MIASVQRALGLLWVSCILVACSSSRSVELTQPQFQALISEGFQAPRIVTIDLPMTARAQLYLEVPVMKFADSRKNLLWSIDGEVEVDIADKFTSGRMSVVLEGEGDLQVDTAERGVFLSNVSITGKDITVTSNLIQMLVLDALAEQVARSLDDMLLFPIQDDSPLAGLMQQKAVSYQVEPDKIIFTPAP